MPDLYGIVAEMCNLNQWELVSESMVEWVEVWDHLGGVNIFEFQMDLSLDGSEV
jgi:hypothetical protein